MAHETHNDTSTERSKSQVSFTSSFWLIVILVGLFIAALNFISVMGHGEEGKEGKEGKTEEMHGAKHEEAEHKEAKEEAKPEAEHKDASKEEAKPAAEEKPAPEHK